MISFIYVLIPRLDVSATRKERSSSAVGSRSLDAAVVALLVVAKSPLDVGVAIY
jgi:hypothetical protein